MMVITDADATKAQPVQPPRCRPHAFSSFLRGGGLVCPPQMNNESVTDEIVSFRALPDKVIESPDAQPGDETMKGNTRRALVIEDDAEMAEQLVDCLQTSGYWL
jgi:hypothetical protein